MRLFAVACCYQMWELLRHKRSRRAVLVAEKYADGLATQDELRKANRGAAEAGERAASLYRHDGGAFGSARDRWEAASVALATSAVDNVRLDEHFFACCRTTETSKLIRDIVNPFYRAVLSRDWLTSNVIDIARTIYADRCFDRLPILADALLDGGCNSDEILEHVRSRGPHVRGCWAVDLILGEL